MGNNLKANGGEQIGKRNRDPCPDNAYERDQKITQRKIKDGSEQKHKEVYVGFMLKVGSRRKICSQVIEDCSSQHPRDEYPDILIGAIGLEELYDRTAPNA